ncbi:hypothetical protein ACJX0J_032115, partial [Zea mays]
VTPEKSQQRVEVGDLLSFILCCCELVVICKKGEKCQMCWSELSQKQDHLQPYSCKEQIW